MLPVIPVDSGNNIHEERLEQLYDYWKEKCGGRPAPAHTDIDPVEIPELLGYLNIFDVRDDPRDFLVRLNGSRIAEMLGGDITGKLLSEVDWGKDGELCRAAFERCVDECRPLRLETSLAFCGKPYATQRLIVLPLCGESGRIERIITAHAQTKTPPMAEQVGRPLEADSRTNP